MIGWFDPEEWNPQKSERTKDVYPVIATSPEDRPKTEWTSSDFGKQIAFEITGLHTYHLQENLELLRMYLNTKIENENEKIRERTLSNGVARFKLDLRGNEVVFEYVFDEYASAKSLKTQLLAFVEANDVSIAEPL